MSTATSGKNASALEGVADMITIRHRRSTRVVDGGAYHVPREIANPAIQRMAKRAGVRRISRLVYDECRLIMHSFLGAVLHDALLFATNNKRKTIMASDVAAALRRQGLVVYKSTSS
jgi:histone H4